MAGNAALALLIDIQARDTASMAIHALGASLMGIFGGVTGPMAAFRAGLDMIGYGLSNLGKGGWQGKLALVGLRDGAAQAGGALLQMGAQVAMAIAKFVLLAAVLGAAVAIGLGVVAVRAAGDFQQGLNRLVTGAGDVTDNMAKMGQGILGVSVETGVLTSGTQGLNAAMYLIISSGQRGAQALDTLSVASKGAVIEQASVVDVSNVLSGVMTNYGTKTYNATQFMNGLITAVQQGKITLQQLSVAMGPLDPIAKMLGVSFNDVAAAMTTQTNAMIPAEVAATGLRFLMQSLENPTKKATTAMKSMGLSTIDVANEMKLSLPGALQMIYNAAKKAGPEGTVPFNRAFQDMIGGMRSWRTAAALTGSHMDAFIANSAKIKYAMDNNKTAVIGWAVAQSNFNVQLDRAKAVVAALFIAVGTQLLPVVTQIVAAIVPVIAAFVAWIQKTGVITTSISGLAAILGQIGSAFHVVFDPVKQVTQALQPMTDAFDRASAIIKPIPTVFKPLLDAFDRATAVIKPVHAALNPMADSFDRATAVIKSTTQVTNPFIAIFQQVAAVVTAVIPIFQRIWAVLQAVGAFIVTTFTPVWVQLQSSFKQVQAALLPIMPQLTMLAQVIGVAIVGAVIIAIGILAGLVSAFAYVLVGVMQVITGVIQFGSGLVQVITSTMQLVSDIFSGQWGKIAGDLGGIMNGISTMIAGAFTIIVGIISGAWGVVVGFTQTFASTVVGIIQGLANTLVGHSIIPDMITSIVTWFASLPGKAMSAVHSLVGLLTGFFNNLASQAITWGATIINSLAAGIRSAIGAVSGAISSVVGVIASFLPHSPAKEGPLRDLNTFGPALTHGFAAGILGGLPEVTHAAGALARSVQLGGMGASGNAMALAGGAGAASGAGTINIIMYLDSKQITEVVGIRMAKEIRIQSAIRNS